MNDIVAARNRRRRWLAGAAGVAAVGSIAGAAVAQSVTRRTTSDDPYADEDFYLFDADRSTQVLTEDGVELEVRESGPPDAALTVVFAHGFCLDMGSFHFQRARLLQEWGAQVRMVFYDQRGHGWSQEADPDTYTVPQLGRDLEAVLAVTAPRGPIVLVGHSMGGMTVLSHARQFPRHYGSRIVGAAVIASAAKGVARSPLGEVLKNPALEAVQFSARYAPKLMHRGRGAARAVIGPILRAASYGDERISPSVVAFSEQMMHDTPIATLVGFLHALEVHDETASIPVLSAIPTLIACGDQDLLTPVGYSRALAGSLWGSELVVAPGAGHLVQLEEPEIINDALVRLVGRATPGRLARARRRLRDRNRRV